jgi:purine-nucleoside phosphorylase
MTPTKTGGRVMAYKDLLLGIERFGSSAEDVCQCGLGVSIAHIRERVVIAPWWEPPSFSNLGRDITLLNSSEFPSVKVWNISASGFEMTFIKTGIGAPVLMDVVLALGVTACKKAVFIGSVGALDAEIGIGDIVIPEYSVCGDGASRYLKGVPLKNGDAFGERSYPCKEAFDKIKRATEETCERHNVKWHIGRNFSIDTIFAQFAHIREIVDLGCNVIEMESAAGFRAASLAGISLGALLSVSDNVVINKSLLSGRSEEERNYRREVRRNIFPKIILAALE